MKLSVLVPTWKRYKKLENALESLVEQSRRADQVIVVYRDIDPESLSIIKKFESKLPLTIVEVKSPGVIHAENAALEKVSGDIVSFLDDDAIAPVDWLENIETFFSEHPEYAAVGGSDLVLSDAINRVERDVVGKITWYGKVIGNHHQKVSHGQEVDVLKGVNMSFRKEFICSLDEKLGSEHHVGNGSQWELDLCFHVKSLGGRLYFSPDLEVKHDSNHDHFVKYASLQNNARNLTYVMMKHLRGWKKFSFLFYYLLIGNSQLLGILRFLFELRKGVVIAVRAYYYSLKGFWAGIRL